MVASASYIATKSAKALTDHLLHPQEEKEDRDAVAAYLDQVPPREHDGPVPEVQPDMPSHVAKALAVNPWVVPSRKEVENIVEGKRADGEPVGRRITADYVRQDGKKVLGRDVIDVTLSADISWGLMRANTKTLAGKAMVDAVIDGAAADAMGMLVREIGYTRRGAGGRQVVPGNVGYIKVRHHTTKPTKEGWVSPDEHSHFIIPNVAVDENGRVGAIDLRRMSGLRPVVTAYFNARLLARGRAMGMAVEIDPRTHAAVVGAVPANVRDAFSRRSQDAIANAKAYAASRNIDWSELKQKARTKLIKAGARMTAGSTRDGMADPAAWRAEMARLGFPPVDPGNPLKPTPLAPEIVRAEIAFAILQPRLAQALTERPALHINEVRLMAARALSTQGMELPEEINGVMRLLEGRGVEVKGTPTPLIFGSDPERGGARFVALEMPRGSVPASPLTEPQARQQSLLARAVDVRRGTTLTRIAAAQQRETPRAWEALTGMFQVARLRAAAQKVQAVVQGASRLLALAQHALLQTEETKRRAERLSERAQAVEPGSLVPAIAQRQAQASVPLAAAARAVREATEDTGRRVEQIVREANPQRVGQDIRTVALRATAKARQEMSERRRERGHQRVPTRVVVNEAEAVNQLREALQSYGLRTQGHEIVFDGRMHYLPTTTNKGNEKSGGYRAHLDERGANASIFNWQMTKAATGWVGNWSAKGERVPISPERLEKWKADREREAQARAAETARRHAAGAAKAAKLYQSAKPEDGTHGYLVKKGLNAVPNVRRDDAGNLVIPLYGADGKIKNAQTIAPDGQKRFVSGAEKVGTAFRLGAPKEGSPVIIAEGFATAARIHAATGEAVIVAVDAGNLLPVARVVRQKMPDKEIVFAADNDHHLPGRSDGPRVNVGIEKARDAAKEVGNARIWAPAPDPKREAMDTGRGPGKSVGTDWDDVGQLRGNAHIAREWQRERTAAMGERMASQGREYAPRERHSQRQGVRL